MGKDTADHVVDPLEDAQPDPNDPPLPSYTALMASEAQQGGYSNVTSSPQPFDTHTTTVPSASHARTPSIEHAPYAPVDYGLPTSQYPSHSAQSQYGHDPNHGRGAGNRSSGGSVGARRPVSDPNEMDLLQLSFTSSQPRRQPITPPGVARQQSMPSSQQYPPRQTYGQRQRTATGEYHAGGHGDPAASVYSLDTGLNAYGSEGGNGYGYGGPSAYAHQASQGAGYAQADFSNPYYAAANDFLGIPPGSQPQASSS